MLRQFGRLWMSGDVAGAEPPARGATLLVCTTTILSSAFKRASNAAEFGSGGMRTTSLHEENCGCFSEKATAAVLFLLEHRLTRGDVGSGDGEFGDGVDASS